MASLIIYSKFISWLRLPLMTPDGLPHQLLQVHELALIASDDA